MLTDFLSKFPPFSNFLASFSEEKEMLYDRLWDFPKALLCHLLLKESQQPLLVITSGQREDRILFDLQYLTKGQVKELPAWETLPGEEIAPSPDIVGKRFEVVSAILHSKSPLIVLASLEACLQKLPALEHLSSCVEEWKLGQTLPFEKLPEKLEALGYRRAKVVADKGEYALRGGIIDLFPLQSFDPYRVEFFGDTIEQIKTFNPVTQISVQKIESLKLVPADEMALLKKSKAPATLLELFKKPPAIVFDDLLSIEDHAIAIKKLPGANSPYCLPFEEFLKKIKDHRRLYFTKHPLESLVPEEERDSLRRGERCSLSLFGTTIEAKWMAHGLERIAPFIGGHIDKPHIEQKDILETLSGLFSSKGKVIFLTANISEEKKLKEDLQTIPLPFACEFLEGYLSSGLILPEKQIAVIPYSELSKRYKIHREKWRSSYHTPASEFHELEMGDLVVHFHNGIGKYLGIEKQRNHLGEESEFIIIEYAAKSKLYVPLSQSHLISRYIGSKEEQPALHTLGSSKWLKVKTRAQQSIIGYAKELLQFQAERIAQGGFVYPPEGEDMELFEIEFPFEETEDQNLAIEAIKSDMKSGKAMDRLLCGDVGYGKTEVAMRAAFKAVVDGGKQVAVLVPTTVLALQHYETFKERMANFPITIAALSRFGKQKDLKKSLKEIEEGKIDIVIGTHRLISKDVKFERLGLVIIDEEQRFGVRAKEHLRKIKTGVDCLTLSATPIPRTLYLSLVGARDLSIINTPPQDRLPIKSIIAERDLQIVKNGLLREFSRDGQAYFIHNRVESIHRITKELQELVPDKRLKAVHGQMAAEEIDEIFHAFKNGEVDLLIATTIVENGLDIPNANTIFIDRSDTFGLADLYQLRGRVGRWNRPAHAYFLIPRDRTLQEMPQKRLQALIETSVSGGGLKLAMKDLEIRGAGDILGVQQSGQVSSIGFHLYCKFLKRAVEALKEKKPLSFLEAKIEIPFKALIPDQYIQETSIRLEIYHRLGELTTLKELDTLMAELKDRFGTPPIEVLWLYHLTRIRLFASRHQFTHIKLQKRTLYAERQKGKNLDKRTLIFELPKSPAEAERHLLNSLEEAFSL